MAYLAASQLWTAILFYVFYWGASTPPVSRPPASPKSASGLPGNIDFCMDISNFPGRPEADLREAGGLWGGGAPPGKRFVCFYFWN